MVKLAVITGTSGVLGAEISKRFKKAGYLICGLDKRKSQNKSLDIFIQIDFNDFVKNAEVRENVLLKIRKWAKKNPIRTIVNNAAYQFIASTHPMDPIEISKSYNINVIAPYLLITNLVGLLTPEMGSVINVGSIHARLTKPGFLAYSLSKSALSALTRALAIDYEGLFRINCIEPAAINTPMLLEGFTNLENELLELKKCHPQNRIATPKEIAEMIYLINSEKVRFLHGASVDISGGIAGRLHDPI